jgi:hypothetical protein
MNICAKFSINSTFSRLDLPHNSLDSLSWGKTKLLEIEPESFIHPKPSIQVVFTVCICLPHHSDTMTINHHMIRPILQVTSLHCINHEDIYVWAKLGRSWTDGDPVIFRHFGNSADNQPRNSERRANSQTKRTQLKVIPHSVVIENALITAIYSLYVAT